MNQKREQILAAVKKLGASSPLQISDHTGLSSSLCGYHLRGLVDAGLLKATGSTASRKYEAADAPPQERKAPKGKKQRARKQARAARPRPTAESDFIVAMTHDMRAVVIEDGSVKIFSPEQTSAIADVTLHHFTA